MKESVWGYFVIVIGIIIIFLTFFFQNITNTDEHNMTLLKSVTRTSMIDAIDWEGYKTTGNLKISEGAFVETFIRKFSEDAQLASTYKIEIYNVQEEPPLVNIKVYTSESTKGLGENVTFNLVNTLNAILETDPNKLTSEVIVGTISYPTDDRKYQCALVDATDDKQLVIYSKTSESKVKAAYIDGYQALTETTLSVSSKQIKGYMVTKANGKAITIKGKGHTGNIIFEDGNVALCEY